MYRIFRKIIGYFNAEWSHTLTLWVLQYVPQFFFRTPRMVSTKAMGLQFKHPVGLAAGFDKDGQYIKALSKLGFSCIEVGTVTPRAQPGNPKPRLFRADALRALINRMGFNNAGVDALVARLKAAKFDGVLGVSIGPNKNTPPNKVWLDYEYCLKAVYPYADYIAVNISSPNTPGLRELHHQKAFNTLIHNLVVLRQSLMVAYDSRYVPIVVKVSPDESDEAIKSMTKALMKVGLDGMILTNTTRSRKGFRGTRFASELGGVSGAPLRARALECLKLAKSVAKDDFVLIASGGVDSVDEACARLKAGASFVQLYTGLVYEGPKLVSEIAKAL